MSHIYISGFDPGQRDAAISVLRVFQRNLMPVVEPVSTDHFSSEHAKGLGFAEDLRVRSHEFGQFLDYHLSRGISAVVSEIPTFLTQNSKASVQLFGSWLVLEEHCRMLGIPTINVTAKEVRSCLGVPAGSDKEAVQAAVFKLFPGFTKWPGDARALPHCVDSMAAAYTASLIRPDLILTALRCHADHS